MSRARRAPARTGRWPALDRTAAAVVFDWDGTAVPDRAASAAAVRTRVERLSDLGVHVAVVSGTHLGNVDGQLRARPRGPGRLWLCLNRGSQLYEVDAEGARLLEQREEGPATSRLLDAAADDAAQRLRERGMTVALVSSRLNRRKLDLLPEPAWADPPKARIAEVLAETTARSRAAGFATLGEVADLVARVATASGLEDARVTTDGKHVEVGVTDKSDSWRQVAGRLARLGVGPGLVLLAGDELGPLGGRPGSDSLLLPPEGRLLAAVSVGAEPEGTPYGVVHRGGGPEAFLDLLDEQLRRARQRRVPSVDPDPAWTLTETGRDPWRHRVTETLFTVASGGVGTRGCVEEDLPDSPSCVVAGVYAGDGVADGLAPGPTWTHLEILPSPGDDVRVLDLRTGVLRRDEVRAGGVPLRSARFASLEQPGAMAMRAEAAPGRLGGRSRRRWTVTPAGHGGVGAAVSDRVARGPEVAGLERLAVVLGCSEAPPSRAEAAARLARAEAAGFEVLLARQRARWADRWERATVTIDGDPTTQLGLRFALYQLWSLSGAGPETAVGARSIAGPGYCGHVFWDADVFVLPALATMDEQASTAMVAYRLARLPAAHARARAARLCGARFPWESAATGLDVTPDTGFLGGQPVAILTGELEEHITADVAWAVVHNATWTRRDGHLTSPERELLCDTARYWAARARVEGDGRAHLDGVIGPDEYHEAVDDNAFTNVMARWNLRVAAARGGAPAAEAAHWRRVADALVDGYDAGRGVTEQFRGYFGLEPLLMTDVARPPAAVDVLLGHERVAASQLVKQPDVLMLHQLVPELMPAGALERDLDLYAPRTAHGSSLSPAVVAGLLARAGRPDDGLPLLRLALDTDLEDVAGTTASGIHIAACAGAWQALLTGFLGIRLERGALVVEPRLPREWRAVEVRFRCRGSSVRVRADRHDVRIETDPALPVRRGR